MALATRLIALVLAPRPAPCPLAPPPCRVHLSRVKLTREVEFYSERLAALTPGMSGADIANVCNEGALVAARSGKESVDMIDFETAIDRVIGGLEKKNKVCVGVRESGHEQGEGTEVQRSAADCFPCGGSACCLFALRPLPCR
jgi:hypothetical protein